MTRLNLTMVAAAIVGAVTGTLVVHNLSPYIDVGGNSEHARRSNDRSSAAADASGFSSELISASENLKKSLPIMVDQETRLDATIPGPGNQFTYIYTLVNRAKEDLDLSRLREYLRSQTISKYKTDASMSDLRKYNVELHYQYKDKRGVFLFDLTIAPKDF